MDHDISDFLLGLHDASMQKSPGDFQRWTLREISRVIDFDFAIWGAGDGSSRELHTATILDQVDSLFDTWETVKQEDPFANLVIGNTGTTWLSTQLPGFAQCRAYHEHWNLYRARQMMSTMELDPQTGLHIFVTLARDNPDISFTAREVAIKNMITRHLFLAARHNDQHCLRDTRAPAAFVDSRGLISASLPDFTNLMTTEWGPPAGRRLPEQVNAALWVNGSFQNQRLCLLAEPYESRLLVRASQRPAVLLSPREQEIAWAYASGGSHKEVARDLGIAPSTVRTHLSRVYQKLMVSDKGALAIWLQQNIPPGVLSDVAQGLDKNP